MAQARRRHVRRKRRIIRAIGVRTARCTARDVREMGGRRDGNDEGRGERRENIIDAQQGRRWWDKDTTGRMGGTFYGDSDRDERRVMRCDRAMEGGTKGIYNEERNIKESLSE